MARKSRFMGYYNAMQSKGNEKSNPDLNKSGSLLDKLAKMKDATKSVNNKKEEK